MAVYLLENYFKECVITKFTSKLNSLQICIQPTRLQLNIRANAEPEEYARKASASIIYNKMYLLCVLI